MYKYEEEKKAKFECNQEGLHVVKEARDILGRKSVQSGLICDYGSMSHCLGIFRA